MSKRMIERSRIAFLLYALGLAACDRGATEAERRIEAAAAEVKCEAAKKNVLLLVNVAGGEGDSIEAITRLAEEGKLTDVPASKLEGEVARKLYKYQDSWAVPIKSARLDNGVSVPSYSERDELAWKVGKEICLKLTLK